MSASFTKLDEEKKNRIIQVAMEEFIENGFERASTNQIVKKAKIGKGVLFYHFNSKREFFDYLVEYSLRFYQDEYVNRINEAGTDLLLKIEQEVQARVGLYQKNPYIIKFLFDVALNEEVYTSNKVRQRIEDMAKDAMDKVFNPVDTTLLREDISKEMIFNFIQWTIEGYKNERSARLKGTSLTNENLEESWSQFYEYIKMFRVLFYR